LPVFTTPSSVSIAPAEVTTQSGHGCGPRWLGMMDGQVDHRCPSSGSTEEKTRFVSNCNAVSFAKARHRGGVDQAAGTSEWVWSAFERTTKTVCTTHSLLLRFRL
jgi:hypothetical protein